MATFIEIDSIRRDRQNYPNPAEFQVSADQLIGFFSTSRSVRATALDPSKTPLEYVTSVRLIDITIPWVINVGQNIDFSALPRIYIDIHSSSLNDKYLISSIEGANSDARFIATYAGTQTDDSGNKLWVHFKCNMEQVMRFKRNDTIVFRVFSRDGNTLPITDNPVTTSADPLSQVMATFQVTPYYRDNEYSNHATA